MAKRKIKEAHDCATHEGEPHAQWEAKQLGKAGPGPHGVLEEGDSTLQAVREKIHEVIPWATPELQAQIDQMLADVPDIDAAFAALAASPDPRLQKAGLAVKDYVTKMGQADLQQPTEKELGGTRIPTKTYKTSDEVPSVPLKTRENWFRGNKDELLFERLIKKWAK